MLFGIRENDGTKVWRVVVHIAFFSCIVACQSREQVYDEKLRQCVELSQSKLAEGTKCLEALLKINPDRPIVHSFLASNYRRLGELDKAERAIQTFLHSYPLEAFGHESYCEILRDKDDLPQALLECYRANELAPENEKLWLTTADVQEKMGKIGEAELNYKKALKLKPDDHAALLFLGSFYERRGRLDEAISTLERLLELKPENAEKLKAGIEKLKAKRSAGPAPK